MQVPLQEFLNSPKDYISYIKNGFEYVIGCTYGTITLNITGDKRVQIEYEDVKGKIEVQTRARFSHASAVINEFIERLK